MPRVLHVIAGLDVGGAEIALYRLVAGTRESEYTHAVVALTTGGPMAARLREAGIDVTTLDFKAAPFAGFLKLVSIMRMERPDIVQTWMYHADMLGGLAARLAGIRNVIWGIRTSALGSGDSRATVFVQKLCAWLSRRIPHTIVCVAEAARQNHVAHGYDARRMAVIPNGFDLAQFTAQKSEGASVRMQYGIGEQDVLIGMVGRFNANKDQHNFVRAAGLLARHQANVRFLMVGRDIDAANAELMCWIAQTGHAERFVLLGERSDVPACLQALDVFCLSSRTEGFPNVVGEAMAMGVPCVVTDVGDAAMLVGRTGIVVPKENPGALAEGMAALLAMKPDVRQRLGQQAKARIREEFSAERARQRFEALYQTLTRENEIQCAA
ncbi:glycosyltransferase family 4 protein [Noviherbaspirillum denitrificans]|uniref:Glycosyl transferase n=1 Tax=Noviherbaspirillum denitrificans TaxID=1968433 RepID=A0A254T7L9_9BURK|nr:glycosyltransferase [Noviherbaspirillum denitrificans]OWW18565.1 glycosyl transferase [Noviherbaspirillum denitrificans]